MTEDDGIEELSVEAAVEQHFEGAIHCAMLGRWEQIEAQIEVLDFVRVATTWPHGRPDLRMICVDTTGFTPEQTNAFLSIWYGGDDLGVSAIANESIYKTAEKFRKKKGK
jgi:hypothetical protein